LKEPVTGATGISRFSTRLHRTSLQIKITALGAVVTAAVLFATFWVLSVEVRATTRARFAAELSREQNALLRLQRQNLAQLISSAAIITQNTNLRSALGTFRAEANFGGPRLDLVNTVERELGKLLQRVDGDLLVVTDDVGRVFAASVRSGSPPPRGTDLSRMAAVHRALDPAFSADSGELAVYRDRTSNYQAAVYPLVQGDYTIGTLLLGERLDSGLVASARAAFGGQVVVTAGQSVLAGTLGPQQTVLAPRLANLGAESATSTLTFDGSEHVVAGLPLGKSQEGEPVTLWLLQPLEPTVLALTRPLLRQFVLYGVLAVLIAAIGSGLATHSMLRPVREFVSHMGSAATSDRPEDRFDARLVPVEVRTLHQSLERLMASIATKQLELRQRTTELTAANAVLTDEIRERQRVERDLRERDEQLRQSQKLEAVGTLAGGIAHDFNNLLTAVSGFTQLALMDVDPKSPLASDLREVVRAADRAGHLTKQLLAFSRKQVLQPTVLDVSDVVNGVAPMLERLLGEQVTLRLALHDGVARVMADRGQLEQVLMNLAINARDAMPHGGVLTISVSSAWEDRRTGVPVDRRVVIAVSDTGTGIPEAIRDRIFEPFFTTKETGKGTGLGLSTVYGIVRQSGGTIHLDSKVGVGTTFSIALPAVSESAKTEDQSIGVTDLPRGSETILLAEDDPAVRAFARRTLEELGYTVLPAVDGVEAMKLAVSARVDLILSDIVMPRMSGPQLVQRFLAEYPAPVVIFMSGYADEALLAEGRHLAAALMRKPFAPATLAQTVRDALDASRRANTAVVG
jgi:signal transduction histidine kinase/ActR/RegA family two-component response regulator